MHVAEGLCGVKPSGALSIQSPGTPATSLVSSRWRVNIIPTHLKSSTSVDDRFDKNPQICSSFSRFVAFQAHAKTGRTWIIQRDLEGELFSVFQRECAAAKFSFLLRKGTWKEWREESRLIFPHSDGQTQMQLVRWNGWPSHSYLASGWQRLVFSLCKGYCHVHGVVKESWELYLVMVNREDCLVRQSHAIWNIP